MYCHYSFTAPAEILLIEQVQKILGHEQIDTTLRYAMVNQNNVKLSHRKYIS